MEDKIIGVVLISLLLTLGFLIDNERGNKMEVRQAVIHLLEASDEVQELAGTNIISIDEAIKIKEDIKKVIESLYEARNQKF